MKALSTLIILVLALSSGCKGDSSKAPEFLVKVGESEISRTDMSYKIGVEKAYGNKTITRPAALVSLVNDSFEREVMREFGLNVTPEELRALSNHADKTSKAPETLAKVKRVFGNDRAAYERLYLAPRIANRKLRGWYSRSAEIHTPERTKIERAYSLAQSGKSLEQAAQECGLNFSVVESGKTDRALPPLLSEHFSKGEQGFNDPMMPILETLSEGEIYTKIVEDDYGYKVVKFIERNEAQYKIEVVTARKSPFTKWFLEQAANVPVKFFDSELEKELAVKYPNVWWVKKWCRI